MASEITTVTKDGSLRVKLPKRMQRAWSAAKLSVRLSADVVVIQRVQQSSMSFSDMLEESRKAAKKAGITRADVEKAIRWARRTNRKVK